MRLDRLDTRWWNLGAGLLAAAVVGCGPKVLLIDDAGDDGTADTGEDGIEPVDTDGPQCTVDTQCPDGQACSEGQCIDAYSDEYYNDEYNDDPTYEDDDDYNDEYSDDDYCYDGSCYDECYDASDCKIGSVCETGFKGMICTPVPALPACAQAPSLTLLPVTVTGGSPIFSLAFVDADGDAPADLVIGRSDGADLLVGATLAVQALPTLGGVIVAATSGEFTGDGVRDLVVSHSTGTVALLAGDGVGGFAVASQTSISAPFIELHPLNWDGQAGLDLVGRNSASGPEVLIGDNAGSFAALTLSLPDSDAVSVVGGTFDSSGFDGVLAADPTSVFGYDGSAMPDADLDYVLFEQSAGTRMLLTADFGGDGIDDPIAWTPVSSGWVLLEPGLVQGGPTRAVLDLADFGTLADLDGDATPDLLLLETSSLHFVRGDFAAGPGFECVHSYALDGEAGAFAAADITGDGAAEVAWTDGSSIMLLSPT